MAGRRLRRRAEGVVSARRALLGATLAVVLVAALAGAMLPLRSHLSAATTALVLVVPVVAGVAVGGFTAGVTATVAGFLVYDYLFIPPYYTLDVGAAQNWAALGVYGVVMVIVARVVAQLHRARRDAQQRAREVRRLFDLSEWLVRESTLGELLQPLVEAARQAFDLDGAALLLPSGDRLALVASDGVPLSEGELRQLGGDPAVPVSLQSALVERGKLQALPLVASGRPIALLVLRGLSAPSKEARELVQAFANHLALALERAQLHEDSLKARLLVEVDRLRSSMVGAVSHDLRTPLASIKVSASTLADPEAKVEEREARELASLIDEQADRLERLVSNLLDMTRIESGALELRRQPAQVGDLVGEAVALLPRSEKARVRWRGSTGLPSVDVDGVLIRQVLANLIDNATRYSPPASPVIVSAHPASEGHVRVSVRDEGPGIAAGERVGVFQLDRREAGGRGGLGLAIAHAFLAAHGQRIWVDDTAACGTCVVFTLPVAAQTGAG